MSLTILLVKLTVIALQGKLWLERFFGRRVQNICAQVEKFGHRPRSLATKKPNARAHSALYRAVIYIQKGLGLDINGCPNWPLGAYAPVYGVYLGRGRTPLRTGILKRGRTPLRTGILKRGVLRCWW